MGIQKQEKEVGSFLEDKKEFITNCRMVVGATVFFAILLGAAEYHFEVMWWVQAHPFYGWPVIGLAAIGSAALVLRLLVGCDFCKEKKYCPNALRPKRWGKIHGADE